MLANAPDLGVADAVEAEDTSFWYLPAVRIVSDRFRASRYNIDRANWI